MWGAGLAKYKWVANLPGLVFSSNEVVNGKGDFDIYENTSVREGATACLHLSPEYITDLPNAATVVSTNMAMRNNFMIDIDGLCLAVDNMIASVKKS